MTSARPVLRPVILLTLFLGGGTSAFAADEAFKKGIEARQKSDWPAVQTQMLQAIKENGTESPRSLSVGGFLGIRDVKVPYLPHFFLGEALFRQNQCVPAMDAWTESQQQGAVEREAEQLRILQDGIASCVSQGYLKPEDYTAAVSATTRQLADARTRAQSVTRYGAENDSVWRGRSEWDSRLKGAIALIDQAQKELDGGRVSHKRADLQRSTSSLANAAEALDGLDRDLRVAVTAAVQVDQRREKDQSLANAISDAQGSRQRLAGVPGTLPPAALQARKDGDAALAEAQTVHGDPRRTPSLVDAAIGNAQRASALFRSALELTDRAKSEQEHKKRVDAAFLEGSGSLSRVHALLMRIDDMAAQRPGRLSGERAQAFDNSRKVIANTQKGFDRAHRQQNPAAMRQAVRGLEAVRAQLQSILETFGPLTLEDRGIPSTLQEAVSSFLRGDYRNTLVRLDAARAESMGEMALHAHLFRAAALYAMFIQSGERDAELRVRATAAVTAARAQQQSFQPDPRVFSTRFIAFFRSSGPGKAPGAGQLRQ
jgi:hypothetical protein